MAGSGGSSEFTTWRFDQIFTLGLGVADMPPITDVTAIPWLGFNSGSGAPIFSLKSPAVEVTMDTDAIDKSPTGSDSSGGAWYKFIHRPYDYLSRVLVNRDYDGTFNPKTVMDASIALERISGWMLAKQIEFNEVYQGLGDNGSGWKGTAAGAYRDVVGNVSRAFENLHHQMFATPESGYDTILRTISEQMVAFLPQLQMIRNNWQQQPTWTPAGSVWAILQGAGLTVYTGYSDPTQTKNNRNAKDYGTEHPPNATQYVTGWANSHYGNLSTAAGWANVEAAAKALFVKTATDWLDTPGQAAITQLGLAYNGGTDRLLPVQRPPMTQITPPPVDPNAAQNEMDQKLKDQQDAFDKAMNDAKAGAENQPDPNGAGAAAVSDPGAGGGGLPGSPGAKFSAGALGGVPGGVPGGAPGSLPGGLPGAVPGGAPGGLPGLTPGDVPGAMPGGGAGGGTGGGIGGLVPLVPGVPGAFASGAGGGTPVGARRGGVAGALGGNGQDGADGSALLQTPALPPGFDVTPPPVGPGSSGYDAAFPNGGLIGQGAATGQGVSTGRFVDPATAEAAAAAAGGTGGGAGAGAVPFYPPMMGGMGGGGMPQSQQERERSTWLAEDEDVWGTDEHDPPTGIGRENLAPAAAAVDPFVDQEEAGGGYGTRTRQRPG
jgi:hypothetical protein